MAVETSLFTNISKKILGWYDAHQTRPPSGSVHVAELCACASRLIWLRTVVHLMLRFSAQKCKLFETGRCSCMTCMITASMQSRWTFRGLVPRLACMQDHPHINCTEHCTVRSYIIYFYQTAIYLLFLRSFN